MGENTGIRILTAVGLAIALGGVHGLGPAAVAGLYVAAVTVPLCVVDARERRLPNALVLPGYAFAAVGVGWEALARGSPGGHWAVAVVGCAGLVLAMLVAISGSGGLGMGDVKLSGLLALALSAGAAPTVGSALGGIAVWLGAAFGALALHGIVEIVAGGRRSVEREVAFGPALLGSFWTTMLMA